MNFQTSYDRNQILLSNTKLIGKELLAVLNNVDIRDTYNQKTNLQNISIGFSTSIVPAARTDIEAGTTADGTISIKLTHGIMLITSGKDAIEYNLLTAIDPASGTFSVSIIKYRSLYIKPIYSIV